MRKSSLSESARGSALLLFLAGLLLLSAPAQGSSVVAGVPASSTPTPTLVLVAETPSVAIGSDALFLVTLTDSGCNVSPTSNESLNSLNVEFGDGFGVVFSPYGSGGSCDRTSGTFQVTLDYIYRLAGTYNVTAGAEWANGSHLSAAPDRVHVTDPSPTGALSVEAWMGGWAASAAAVVLLVLVLRRKVPPVRLLPP